MGFLESYKHLEKICGEMMDDERKLSAYIDEMISTSNGAFCVKGWDDDLKKLKHYRWIRNQIVHEPGYSEQNLCTPDDTEWIDNFYERIMNQTDPLALYQQARKSKGKKQSDKVKNSDNTFGLVIFAACIALIILAVFVAVGMNLQQ